MFSDATMAAVLALVAADSMATPDERRAVSDVMSGIVTRGQSTGDGLVISFAEASRRLGSRNAQFARNLAKAGRLTSVYGGGGGKRPYGVTAKSVEDFAMASSGGAKSA